MCGRCSGWGPCPGDRLIAIVGDGARRRRFAEDHRGELQEGAGLPYDPAEELAMLPPDVAMFHVEPLAVPGLAAERCIIWLQKTG